MPRSTHALPSCSVPSAFICQLASGSYLGRRIVGEAGQVDHAVHAVERALRKLAHFGLHELDLVGQVA
jgi:hypothetical protein